MVIEILYPEICDLYGDMANIRYLEKSVKELSIKRTGLGDKPYFIHAMENGLQLPDMIYMGSTSEKGQLLAIERLKQYREEIRTCIDMDVNFLFTGNSWEILGQEIIEDEQKVCDGLGIFDFVSRRSSRFRENTFFVGDFDAGEESIQVIGFKCLAGFSYGDAFQSCAMKAAVGYGANPDTLNEGIRVHHFIATYLIGPLFIMNPPFARWYFKSMLGTGDEPAFLEDSMAAYRERLSEFTEPGRDCHYFKTAKSKYVRI